MRKTATERNELFVQDFPQFFKPNNQVFEMFKKYKRVLLSTRKCFEQRLTVIRINFDSKFTVFHLFQKAEFLVTDDQLWGGFNFLIEHWFTECEYQEKMFDFVNVQRQLFMKNLPQLPVKLMKLSTEP